MRGESGRHAVRGKTPDDTPHVDSGQPGRTGRFDTGAMEGIRKPADPETAPSKRCFAQETRHEKCGHQGAAAPQRDHFEAGTTLSKCVSRGFSKKRALRGVPAEGGALKMAQ